MIRRCRAAGRGLLLALALAGRVAAGDPAPGAFDLVAEDGEIYRNFQVRRIEPDGLTIGHDGGETKLEFPRLPEEYRRRYEYDPAAAEQYRRERDAGAERALREQAERDERARAERKRELNRVPVRLFGIRTEPPQTNRYRIRFSIRNYDGRPRTVRVVPQGDDGPIRGGRTFTIPALESREGLVIEAYAERPWWLVATTDGHETRHRLTW